MSSPDQAQGSWSDKLTIETPEQTSLDFPLAGVGSRCLALLIDTLLQAAVLIALLAVFILLGGFSSKLVPASDLWAQALWVLASFTFYYGYFAGFEALWNGQTPGKHWTRLRVIQESGRPISAWQAIARNLLRLVDQLPGMYGVGLVTALISRQNRRVGDYVAGTVVVHERPLEPLGTAWAEPAKGQAATGAVMWGTSRLTSEEMQVLEAFLLRRETLDPMVRARLARQVTQRICQTLGITPQ
ncbi:MAG: RDD family protein, partial [Bryobacteraceae bacterium]